MSKFGTLKKTLAISSDAVRFVLAEIEWDPRPVLHVKSASYGNPDWTSYVVELAAANAAERKRKARLARAGGKDPEEDRLTAESIAKDRQQDRDAFPGRVVVGWEGVIDDTGKPVPFTTEDCREFLNALPDDVFDRLRAFVQDANNFRAVAVDPKAAEALGKV